MTKGLLLLHKTGGILRVIEVNKIERKYNCTLIVLFSLKYALSKCILIIFAENILLWTNYLNSFRSF